MLHKAFPVKLKAGEQDGLAEGQFEAIVSVFGNKDSYGDVVLPGAFAETLAEWKASGDPIPILWSHRMDDPDMNIGHVVEAKETDQGLWVRGQLDLEAPKAAQVHRLLKGRRVTQFSFAYDVLDGALAKNDEHGEFYELRKLRLYEVGPTPIGANQETELLDVKAISTAAALVKAGRVLSAKNEKALREALDQISAGTASVKTVLAALDSGQDDSKSHDSTATGSGPVKGSAPEEPTRTPVDLSALHAIELDALASL